LETGLQPAWQSNPLNLSEPEIEKAAAGTGYLGDVDAVQSRVLSLYTVVSYDPRIFNGRRTAFELRGFYHSHFDIPQRNYASLNVSIRQSLGGWRFLEAGYGLLPSLYLRHYRFDNHPSILPGRYACRFGTERGWLEFQHRITPATSLQYRLTRRIERYQAPFSHYDMQMLEAAVGLRSKPLRAVTARFEVQYGQASNDNHLDDLDRSYSYLNIRPALNFPIPGDLLRSISLDGRFDQRAYQSDEITDPLHAGRYQYEYRLDLRLFPQSKDRMNWYPFLGYRQRIVESDSDFVQDLKSFKRWWFGIRIGLNSTIDIYL